MAAVGFELYTQLLAEAVDLRRGRIPPPEPAPVRLELPGSAFLPDGYVGAAGAKLEVYRRFSQVKTDADAEALRAHLLDRFGRDPDRGRGAFSGRSRCAGRRGGRGVRGPRRRGSADPEVAALRPSGGDPRADHRRLPSGCRVQPGPHPARPRPRSNRHRAKARWTRSPGGCG